MQATQSLSPRGNQWDLPALPPKLNRMERFVEWLRNPKTPLFKKVAAVFLTATALFAIATVSKKTAFFIGAGALLWGNRVARKVDQIAQIRKIREERISEQRTKSLIEMDDALGKEYVRLPRLEGENAYKTSPNNLTHPIMKGVHWQHLFIVLKLRSKDDGLVFAVRFFLDYSSAVWRLEGYNSGSVESPNYRSHVGEFSEDLLGTIRQIAVDENHPRLELAK